MPFIIDDAMWLGLAATGASTGLNLFGQSRANADAKRRQAIQDQYNTESWRSRKKVLKKDWKHADNQWRIDIQNDEAISSWKDQTALDDYNYKLKINEQAYQQDLLRYQKSEQIYGQQLAYNKMAQAAANEAEYRKLQDATNEIAFQNQDIVTKALEAEGIAAVKGQQGRSAEKGEQSLMASLGRNQAILAESLFSAKSDTEAALRKIGADKFGADIAAEAARETLPIRAINPPEPITTPRTTFLRPRKPGKADFGPKPPRGISPSNSSSYIAAAGDMAAGTLNMLAKAWTG